MSEVVLSEFEADLSQAHQQVELLLDLYIELSDRDDSGTDRSGAEQRCDELLEFRRALAAELARRDILPADFDRERETVKKIAAAIAELLNSGNHSLIRDEECTLAEICERLKSSGEYLEQGVMRGIAETRDGIGRYSADS